MQTVDGASMLDAADIATAPSAGEPRSSALLVLQVFAWLLAIFPARLVFGDIGYFGSPASLAGLFAFGLWATGAVRPELLSRRVLAIRVAAVLMWLPALISYAVLHLHSAPGDEVNAADRWLLFSLVWTGVMLLGAEGLRSLDEAKRLLRVIVAAASFSAAVAIMQARLNFDLTEWLAKIPGLKVQGVLESVLSRGGLERPAGTASHPIEFGVTMCSVLGFAVVLAFHDVAWARWRRWLCLALIGLAIPMALSRSAIIGGAIVLTFWMVGASKQHRRTTVLGLLGGAVVVFMGSPGLIGTIKQYFVNAGSDSSITTRTSDYAAVAENVRSSPIIGRGPATFLPKYRILDNTWLTFVIEEGLVGIVALLGLYCVPWYLGERVRNAVKDPMARAIGMAAMGLTLLLIIESATFDFWAYPMTPGFLMLLMGCIGAYVTISLTERSDLSGEPNADEVLATP